MTRGPQWRRDVLDGLVDYHVVGSAMRQYPRLVFDRKRPVRRDRGRVRRHEPGAGVEPSARRAGASTPGRWGPTACCPGRRSAQAESWRQGDELALFYPLPDAGRGGAADRTTSPRCRVGVCHHRLKAYRRGQQDVEYLTLWARQSRPAPWAVGRQVREALHLAGSRQATETGGAEDAGRIDYSGLRPQDLWALARCGSARPCPRLIPHPSPGSSIFALRHAIRLQAVHSRRPTNRFVDPRDRENQESYRAWNLWILE